MRNHWKPLAGAALVGVLSFGCGDDSSDPEAVTIEDLKYPKGLTITDQGNGTVQLMWQATNVEDDFDGFNIYGAELTTELKSAVDNAGLDLGNSLQLLDLEGNPVEAAKTVLQNMSYSKDKPFEEIKAAPAEEDAKFAFYPIHNAVDDEGKAVLPTCQPAATKGTVACTPVTGEVEATTFTGQLTYDVTGLTAGKEYCFLIVSSQDGGSEVSAVTSELACIVPRYAGTFEITEIGDKSTFFGIDFAKLRTECAKGAESCVLSDAVKVATGEYCEIDTADAGTVCVENIGGEAGVKVLALTTPAGAAVQNIGVLANGLTEKTVSYPMIDSEATLATEGTTLENPSGYALGGQSVPVLAKNAYVLAEKDGDTGKFFYHLLWAASTDESTTASGTLNVHIAATSK